MVWAEGVGWYSPQVICVVVRSLVNDVPVIKFSVCLALSPGCFSPK